MLVLRRKTEDGRKVKISAKAPCRVDLAGGTLDIWPLYLFHPGALTVNFAVDVYTGCTLAARPGRRICLRSLDLGVVETYASLDELCAAAAGKLTLLAHLVRFFAPERGVNLTTTSQAPSGAGLAGSSALMIAVAAALAEFTGRACGAEALRRLDGIHDLIRREVAKFMNGMKERGARFVFASDHSISTNVHYADYLCAFQAYQEHKAL